MQAANFNVDVYGGCSKYFSEIERTCRREKKNFFSCHKMVEAEYKFYLSFENSLCKDYITEKFFSMAKFDIVPVVLNGVDMSAIAPPHSHINVLDFKAPNDLVQELLKIASNDELYTSYFWWKEFYEVRNGLRDLATAYCDLCAKLNDASQPPKIYNDYYKWWVSDSNCFHATDRVHLSVSDFHRGAFQLGLG